MKWVIFYAMLFITTFMTTYVIKAAIHAKSLLELL